jgi:hypothetical protein
VDDSSLPYVLRKKPERERSLLLTAHPFISRRVVKNLSEGTVHVVECFLDSSGLESGTLVSGSTILLLQETFQIFEVSLVTVPR